MDNMNYRGRLVKLRQKLLDNPFDTIWIIQPENRRYFSGFKAEDTQLNESSGSLLINENHCLLLTDSRYSSEAEIEAPDFEIAIITHDLIDELPDLLKRIGTHKLGFEEEYITWSTYQRLTNKLAGLAMPLELIPFHSISEKLRALKDEMEIKAMEKSAGMISAILDEIIIKLKPGIREKDVAWQIENLAYEAGADSLAFSSIIASGPNSALPHAVPTERVLKANEPIILDVGVKLNGYCSDMTRTIFLGEPDQHFNLIYKIVRKAQLAALNIIRSGIKSDQPDTVAREIIKEAGFDKYFGHALGHGVGLATHESPRLGPKKPIILKKGMIVTVEPGIYIQGKGGVRLEEMVLIEQSGSKILTKANHFYEL